MLTPGESVLQVGARERLIAETGVDPLSANIGPNANKPQIMGGTMFASSGGMVGRESGSYRIPPWNEVGAKVLNWVGRASGEGYKMFGGVKDWVGRASGEGQRLISPAINQIVDVVSGIPGGIQSLATNPVSYTHLTLPTICSV